MLKCIFKAFSPNEPDEYFPTSSEGLVENFAEIKKIIQTSGSQHTIKGNCYCFTIGPTRVLTAVFVFAIIIVLYLLFMGFASMLYGEGSDRYLGIPVCLGVAAYLLYITLRRSPLGAEIGLTIDSDSSQITIFNANILWKHFSPAKLIPFSSVIRVWAEPFKVDGTYDWKKVFIEHDNGITQILALPDGYSVYVDAENFITCFTRIIKSGK